MKYWLYSDGNILGPYEPAELLAAPDFTEESLICDEDSINASRDDWKPAAQFPEFAKLMNDISSQGSSNNESAAAETDAAPSESNSYAEDNDLTPSGFQSSHDNNSDISDGSEFPSFEDSLHSKESGSFEDSSEDVINASAADTPFSNASMPETELSSHGLSAGKSPSDLETRLNGEGFDFDSVSVSPTSFGPEKTDIPDEHKSSAAAEENQSALPQETEAELISNGEDPIEDSDHGLNSASLQAATADFKKKLEKEAELSGRRTVAESDKNNANLSEGPVTMGDFLSSLENILGEEERKSLGADKPPAEVSSLQQEMLSAGIGEGEPKKERNVKEELESVRLEKDLLLGQISLQEMNEGNIRQRISDLIQTFKSNAHKKGGKSVFDDDPDSMPKKRELALESSPVNKKDSFGSDTDDGGQNFSSVFLSESSGDSYPSSEDAIETEIDDSEAATIKTSVNGRRRHADNYDVSNASQGRPPIYVYELKQSEQSPDLRESVTKVSLSDDFRSGQIDFDLDEEDQSLNLLPQQAGGITYDFTILSGKPASIAELKEKIERNRSAARRTVLISRSVGTEDSAKSSAESASAEAAALAASSLADSKKEKSSDDIKSQAEQAASAVEDLASLENSGRDIEREASAEKSSGHAPAVSGIKSSMLSKRHNKAAKEEERQESEEDEGPLLQEITPETDHDSDKGSDSDAVLASMDDEDRLLRETYEAIMAGKDPAMLVSSHAKKTEQQSSSNAWEDMFDAGNLLQAASIEDIGKQNAQESFADSANPFKAADIYATPQQNVQADDFPSDMPMPGDSGAGGSFINIEPVSSYPSQSVSADDPSSYYVDSPDSAVAQNPDMSGGYVGTQDEITQSARMIQENLGDSASITISHQQLESMDSQDEPAEAQPVSHEIPLESEREALDQPSETENISVSAIAPVSEKKIVDLPSERAEHDKEPKVIKTIPASLSSIHRSIRTTERVSDPDASGHNETDLDNMPDFNIELASLDSNRVKGPVPASLSAITKLDKKKEEDNKEIVLDIKSVEPASVRTDEPAPLALELSGMTMDSGNLSNDLPVLEINTGNLNAGNISKGKDKVQVNYYGSDGPDEVKPTVALPVEKEALSSESKIASQQPKAGTLSTVLQDNMKKDEAPAINPSMVQSSRRNGSNKLLLLALGMICFLLFAVLALFMLSGRSGGSSVANIAKTAPEQLQEQQPDIQESAPNTSASEAQPLPAESSQPAQQEMPVQQPAPVSQQPDAQEEPAGMTLAKAAPPVTATDKLTRAVDIVKEYRLSGGRGTISTWFSNSFLGSAQSSGGEWNATPLHEDIYVVQYRLPRSRQDPLIYQFEVDVAKDALLRGINNNAIELLDTGTSARQRAVPSRNAYESEASSMASSSNKQPAAKKETLLQKAKKKFAPKKKSKKTKEINQLPLPPAPKKRYSQTVPTGFEQPEEDSNEAFLKAMESDEELF